MEFSHDIMKTAAFAEFIAEVTSPAFISGLQNIAVLLGIVVSR